MFAFVPLLFAILEPAPPVMPSRPEGAIQVDAAAVVWKDAPPTMPKGTQLAILEGDPAQGRIFTVRLRGPKGFALPLHTHPQHERVTVLEGSVSVALGPSADRASARTFRAGAFYVNPPGLPHIVFSDEGCTIQITGVGPWKVVAVAAPTP